MRKFSMAFWVVLAGLLAAGIVVGWIALQAWALMLVIGALPWIAPMGYWLCVLVSAAITAIEILFTGYKLEDIR